MIDAIDVCMYIVLNLKLLEKSEANFREIGLVRNEQIRLEKFDYRSSMMRIRFLLQNSCEKR